MPRRDLSTRALGAGLGQRPADCPYNQKGVDNDRHCQYIADMTNNQRFSPTTLRREADQLERAANEGMLAYIAAGESHKYSDAMERVRKLRRAAEIRTPYERMEYLRNI